MMVFEEDFQHRYIMHDTLRHDLPFALERLMSQLVNLDPQKRPSAAEVLRQLDLITLNSVKVGLCLRPDGKADIQAG